MASPRRSPIEFKPGDRVTTFDDGRTRHGEVMREQDDSGWITVRWDADSVEHTTSGQYSDILAVLLDPDPHGNEIKLRQMASEAESGSASSVVEDEKTRSGTPTEALAGLLAGIGQEETTTDPIEALRVLFDEAVPAAGTASLTLVEEQFLPWHKDMGAEPENTFRGSRQEIEDVLLPDLEHMRREPGFEHFRVEVVPQQNAVDVLCIMNETSRQGFTVAVPMRVWPCGKTYVAVALHRSWR